MSGDHGQGEDGPPADELAVDLRNALDEEQERVEQRIRSLGRDLEDIVERSGDAVRDDEHDPEGSTIAFERAQVSALLDAARRQGSEIDVARQRLREGVHSTCELCGGPIPTARRLARPTARTCLACAT